jgi:hypothetical protein
VLQEGVHFIVHRRDVPAADVIGNYPVGGLSGGYEPQRVDGERGKGAFTKAPRSLIVRVNNLTPSPTKVGAGSPQRYL